MTLLRKTALMLALAVAPVATAATKAPSPTVPELGLRATNGFDSQVYLGTGKGVTIAVLDAGIDVSHPAIRGSISLSKDFTGQNTVDDDKGATGHATGIASILVGHDANYFNGFAPAAKILNGRITTADDQISDLWAGNGLGWAVKNNAKVVNLSLGNRLGKGALTDKFNLMADYVTERYGVNVVSAAGNENDTAVAQAPGGSYNGYAVGATGAAGAKGRADYNRVTWFSNYAQPTDARTKPDLVAPGANIDLAAANWEKRANYYAGTGTSFAAPMVGGVLAQLIGYGKSKDLPTDPLLLKAVVLTSAGKAKKFEGEDWAARRVRRDDDYGFRYTQPLDEEQGAGRLDGVAAYRLYAKQSSKSTPLNTWKRASLKEDQSYPVKLGKFYAGQRVDATLAWYRHVAIKDKNDNGPDGKDSYWQSATLADFTLTLLRDGVPVAQSDSDVDNLEHLSWILQADGNYSLEVYRFDGSGTESEAFAVAARVVKGDPVIAAALAAARPASAVAATGVT
ncbi:MAG: S8 family serine peptidase, partial [Phycisphaerae bacterium]